MFANLFIYQCDVSVYELTLYQSVVSSRKCCLIEMFTNRCIGNVDRYKGLSIYLLFLKRGICVCVESVRGSRLLYSATVMPVFPLVTGFAAACYFPFSPALYQFVEVLPVGRHRSTTFLFANTHPMSPEHADGPRLLRHTRRL